MQRSPVYSKNNLDNIFLIAPTTSAERINNICQQSSGFVYYVSLKGVTGAGHLDTFDAENKVLEIKQATSLPVGVGFGIKDAESAGKVAMFADAIVVGSAIIREIETQADNKEKMLKNIKTLLSGMRAAMDNVSSNEQTNKEVA